MTERELIVSVTAADCEWSYFRAGGKGGQHQNKTNSGVRVVHPPSGAVGESRVHRDQLHNRRAAWRKMAESPEFKWWVRIQAGALEAAVAPHNILVEKRENGEWVKW